MKYVKTYEEFLNEDAPGGFATPGSTPGMGNPTGPTQNSVGSGDCWPSLGGLAVAPGMTGGKKRKKKKKSSSYAKTYEDYTHDSKFSRSSDKIDDTASDFVKDVHSAVYDGVEREGPITDRKIGMIDDITEKLTKMLVDKHYITKNVLTSKEIGIL